MLHCCINSARNELSCFADMVTISGINHQLLYTLLNLFPSFDKTGLIYWICLFCPYFNVERVKNLDSHSLMCSSSPTPIFSWVFAATNINIKFCIFKYKRCNIRELFPFHTQFRPPSSTIYTLLYPNFLEIFFRWI